jgi:hypothetical protein
MCVFFLGEFSHVGDKQKPTCMKALLEKKNCKSRHILKKKSHMLPYLDNGFPLIARTKKDLLYCLTSSQTWLIPLVDDGYST